jgi:hypothetical protein
MERMGEVMQSGAAKVPRTTSTASASGNNDTPTRPIV